MTTLKEIVALAASLWPNPAWPDDVQVLWIEALAAEPPDNLLAAVLHFYKTDPKGFRPTPGQILALVSAPDPGAPDLAWLKFRRAVEHYAGKPAHETPEMPQFGDPRAASAVRALGGFRQFLGGIPSRELDFLHTRFLKAYARAGEEALLLPEPRTMDLPAPVLTLAEQVGRRP